MRRLNRGRGFTLIELMVVVAIIAIILAIAIPSLNRARMLANERSAVGSLKSFANGQETAAQTLFNGRYWAHDVAGLYFVEDSATPGRYYRFITDVSMAQADLAIGGPIPINATYSWWYNIGAVALQIKSKAGFWFRMHSAFPVGAAQGTNETYGAIAAPRRMEKTGSRVFIVDQGGTVYVRPWAGDTSIETGEAASLEDAATGTVTWPNDIEIGQNWSTAPG